MANLEVTESEQTGSGQTERGHTGKYTVLMELGSGGSATVSAALAKGIAGFSKVVVLKTIRDGLGRDEDTIRMFLGEARLSARMNHPNIVQVYEVYKQSNLPVIVMEYLDGQSLATLLARTWDSDDFLPELGIAILAKTLAGLHYAHTLTDYSGEALHLVHRDVSPHNVMIGYDGQVKLVDFGIAKLRNQSVQTRSGVIKGKLSYMAPEQVHGDVDHRADIFAVGVMLWEILARRRMWGEAGDATIISRLLTADVPRLRDVALDIDPELERICSKALAAEPDERYAQCADMQRDLEAFLKLRDVDVSQEAIGGLLNSTCRDLREQAQASLQQKVMALGLSATAEFDLNEGNEVAQSAAVPRRVRGAAPNRQLLWVALAGGTALLILVGMFATRREQTTTAITPSAAVAVPASGAQEARPAVPPPAPERIRANLAVHPQDARLYLDDRRLSSNPFRDSLPRDSIEHTFWAEADGFETVRRVVRLESDLDLVLSMRPVPAAKAPSAPPPPPRHRPRAAAPRTPIAPPPGEELTAAPAPLPPAPKPPEPAPASIAEPGEDLRGARLPNERARRDLKFDDPYGKK